ncbi:MAG TPA: YkgJ family cysteine cluster protein, partial [Candidatus Poseidoniales archaeon]
SVREYLKKDCTTTLDGRYILRSNQSDGICIYLDGKKQCGIYEVRPQQCKAFPWWAENLRSKRSWNKVKSSCPGLTAEDAILIRGEEIRLHVHSDRQSTQGFRIWEDV